ncbi:hypothetical protein [Sulfurospirillum multivorans]|uniref:Uncharacterized protein n=2 Tax=Sulfurospirillum multivorans TaxID=66821 RepID=A0AA86DYC4_SULMK|nr:hypothetical protein [Sulfurospirillum multivorans]AHJ13088.1 hypothetical protein SMUL_1833 [Sulfurospirillum multivorans DSM 12446]QEH06576.1 hypothetical protein SMN_1811 [Sulfurospirillum multivorans]
MQNEYQVVTTYFYGGEEIKGTFSFSEAKALADTLNSQCDIYAFAEVRKAVD